MFINNKNNCNLCRIGQTLLFNIDNMKLYLLYLQIRTIVIKVELPHVPCSPISDHSIGNKPFS